MFITEGDGNYLESGSSSAGFRPTVSRNSFSETLPSSSVKPLEFQ